jgi:hypothetical protein
MPLHPAIVHIPLVLCGLVPIVAGFLAWQAWRGRGSRRAWLVAIALQLVIVITAYVAADAGSDDAHVISGAVPRDAIHEHAQAAGWFEWANDATLALLVAAAALRDKRSAIAGFAATAAAAVTVAMAFRVGHLGGKIVFEHDAPGALKLPRPAR